MDDTKIKAIANKRAEYQSVTDEFSDAMQAFDDASVKIPEAKALKAVGETRNAIKDELDRLEFDYRNECVEAYQATGDKQYPGLTVTEKNDYDYNEADAIDWAIEKDHPNLLKLNKREFNKVAKGPLCPEFVTKAIQVGTRLATNLSEFLS
ncbi:MAG: hypothetical protein KAJ19_22680 [Gammaproteobacteria bacterium]|nr:hypothetical protein [Gammaproteobacteria bacterium]